MGKDYDSVNCILRNAWEISVQGRNQLLCILPGCPIAHSEQQDSAMKLYLIITLFTKATYLLCEECLFQLSSASPLPHQSCTSPTVHFFVHEPI